MARVNPQAPLGPNFAFSISFSLIIGPAKSQFNLNVHDAIFVVKTCKKQ